MASAPRDDNYIAGLIVEDDTVGGDLVVKGKNGTGAIYVHIDSSDVATGGTSAVDDAAFTAASGSGTPMMGFVTADSVDSGDVGVLGMLANRQLKVTLFDSAGAELSVGGGTQYTEDAAAAANPVGNALIVVREDGRAGSLTSTDGDNVALRGNNLGELYVKHTDTIAVTQSGTWDEIGINDSGNSITVDAVNLDIRDLVNTDVVTAELSAVDNAVLDAIAASVASIDTDTSTIITAVQLIDNLVLLEDAAHSTGDPGIQMLAVRDDTLDVRSGTEGDYEPLHTNADGALWTIDVNSATIVGHVDGIETALTAANSSLDAIEASVAAIDTDATTIIGHLDGVEGLLTTIDADTGSILTSVDGIEALLTTIDADTSGIITSVQLIDDSIFTAGTDTYTEATSKGQLLLAVRRDADTTLANTTNEFTPLQVDANGYLKVEIFDGGGSHTIDGTVTAELSATDNAVLDAIEADTTTIAGAVSGTEMQVDVLTMPTVTVNAHAVTNAGTFAVQVDGSALTALQLIDNTIIVDDAAFTPATTSVNMAGFQADETATDSVDEGDAGAARMTLDRKQIVTVQPHTAGGWSTFMATSGDSSTALTNTAQAVKASAGSLGGWYIYNPNSSAAYVILYNVAAASVTVGTTVAKMILCIPATSAANLELVNGVPFDTAIAIAAATTGAGNSAPTTALEANIMYK